MINKKKLTTYFYIQLLQTVGLFLILWGIDKLNQNTFGILFLASLAFNIYKYNAKTIKDKYVNDGTFDFMLSSMVNGKVLNKILDKFAKEHGYNEVMVLEHTITFKNQEWSRELTLTKDCTETNQYYGYVSSSPQLKHKFWCLNDPEEPTEILLLERLPQFRDFKVGKREL